MVRRLIRNQFPFAKSAEKKALSKTGAENMQKGDSALAELASKWTELPAAVRAGIAAMVKASA
jgi:hypothetical protein